MTPIAPRSQDPPKKKRCLNCETTKNTQGNQQIQSKEARLTPVLSTATTQVGTSSLIGKIEHGQATQILEDELIGYKDLPVEAYKFSALLRLDTTYELMDFLARAQVAATTHMAEEHAETKMIQRALTGELEPHEDRALQKIGQKKQVKSPPLLMELPDLNTALVEAYRDLDRTTRTAKQMARCSKTTSEQRIVVLDQQLQDRQPLGLPPPSNNSQPSPP